MKVQGGTVDGTCSTQVEVFHSEVCALGMVLKAKTTTSGCVTHAVGKNTLGTSIL